MGGKHKQAQRSKQKPSSSGRSAELLASNLPSFSGTKDFNFTLNVSEEHDSLADVQFQLLFKKMNKKDSTTRLKGFQEFSDLVKSSETETVVSILPIWARSYCTFSTDTEHRVREAANVAHHQLVLKVKRNIAPYLKQLAGPWFTAQYDTYPPAASAAKTAFEDAFPQNKLQEAVTYCQDEILTYIYNNLIVHSAQSISNPKTTSPEESEAKYERVLISSLLGYTFYLNKVNPESIEKSRELNQQLISNKKFWNLYKHNLAVIRSAWFGILAVLYVKAPFLLENIHSQLVASVLSSLDETEPTVIPRVWEAVLLTVTTVPDWSQHINVESVFIPKLWNILQKGGQGNAAVIYGNLLPLMSNLPGNIDVGAFYAKFFGNMRIGLTQKSVQSSRLETTAITGAITECLQYVVMKHQHDIFLCEKLIKTQLIPLIEWGLTENQVAYKPLFNEISSLIQYWNRNRNSVDTPNYSRYLKYFWHNISSLFEGLLLQLDVKYETAAVSELGIKQLELIFSLRQSIKPKKQLKVSFAGDGKISSSTTNETNSERKPDSNYIECLNQLVYEVCEFYIKFINEKQSKELVVCVCSLMQEFESVKFVSYLCDKLPGENAPKTPLDMYKNLLSNWLQSSNIFSKPVVQLVFLTIKYLSTKEKEYILKELSELPNDSTFNWCVGQALSHPHCNDPVIQSWLHTEKIKTFLLNIVREELTGECPTESSLILKLAFGENTNGDLFICKETVIEVVHLLSEGLLESKTHEKAVDSYGRLAAYISTILYTDKYHLLYGDELLLGLFAYSINVQTESEMVSSDTLWEVNTSWQDAFTMLSSSLAEDDFLKLIQKFVEIVEKQVIAYEPDCFPFEHFTDVISDFLRCCNKKDGLLDEVASLLLKQLCTEGLREDITRMCVNSEYLKGNVYCPVGEFVKPCRISDDARVSRYFMYKYLICNVFVQPIDTDDEDDLKIFQCLDDKPSMVLNILRDITLGECILNNYTTIKYIKYTEMQLNNIRSLLKQFEPFDKSEVEMLLIEKMVSESWIWIRTANVFYTEINKEVLSNVFSGIISQSFSKMSSLGRLHLVQIFGRHLSYDDVNYKLSTVESITTLRNLLHNEDIDVQIAEVYARIDGIKKEFPGTFYNVNFANWEKTQLAIEIMHLLSALIKEKGENQYVLKQYWDFVVVSLSSWSSRMVEVKHEYKNVQVMGFIIAAINLFCAVEANIKNHELNNTGSSYLKEWKDLFAQDIHTNVIKTWYYLAGELEKDKGNSNFLFLPILQIFWDASNHLDWTYIFTNTSETTPKWSNVLKLCFPLILNSYNDLQLWGYQMLMAMAPILINVDSISVNTNTPHAKGLIFEQFKETLLKTQDIVEMMLIDFKLGESSCRVESFTDSYTYTFAYFLIWNVLLTLCEKAPTELNYQYSDWLRKEDLLNHLLNNTFKLMPAEIFNEIKSKTISRYFVEKPDINIKEPNTSKRLEHLVCWIYSSTLQILPASVRQWWANTETRTSHIVERVTVDYLSPYLCNQELLAVSQHETKFKNMVVKVLNNIRAVKATYTIDEAQMELHITLPTNYPLGGPDVQCNREIGGSSHKQWLMQLKMCVLHQNGRIWDGLALWNRNLDKKFDGVEECYICFAVLHPGTYQLPKLSCHTCRKKFHSACLYKWFSTSNKSTCPICRNLF